ncbi:MAG: alpha/beta hydrolase, partial [Syntrophomonas sp.]
QELGAGVYAFDFWGSGESDGEFAHMTLTSQARDLAGVIDYVFALHHLPIILLGRSFGGSTVLAGGSGDERVAGYILWSTPVRLKDTFAGMLGEAYGQLEEGQDVSFADEGGEFVIGSALIKDLAEHDMDKYLCAIGDRPVLVISGQEDELVDPANAEYMSAHLKNARLCIVEHADHRFTDLTREREDITLAWIEKTFLNGK